MGARRPPNVLLLITDQQRRARHWPDEPGWADALMPNDAELARTGLSFDAAYCNTAMCSPSRATLLTGLYPAHHGVTLTLTAADLRPDPRNGPAVAARVREIVAAGQAPRGRVLRQFARGALGLGRHSGDEPTLPPGLPNLATVLAGAGYEIAYKGKWHLTHPRGNADGASGLLGGWGDLDADWIARELGFGGWEPPDAGENAKAEHFGGGSAADGEGWDELYTRQAVDWLGRADLPEPFCLVVSLVNPHDVLGYPASHRAGGYDEAEFRDLGVQLPETVDEDLSTKPSVHTLMQLGMTAYLGPLRDRAAQLDYVNLYAHLHRLVDSKIGRVLAALGDPDDPESLRSRTVVVRTSDHGEMGMAHGGLRQKVFNVYEETVNVPLVISNPVLFPRPRRTGALATLADVLPTVATLAGARVDCQGVDLAPLLAEHAELAEPEGERLERAAVDLAPVAEHAAPAASVREAVHFTFDDHQAGTATSEAPGQPNRIRAVFDGRVKYAAYLDPRGRARPECELYDTAADPLERDNLVDPRTGAATSPAAARLRDEAAERLAAEVAAHGTGVGPGAAG